MPKPEPEHEGATDTANRRRDPRIPTETPVELVLDAGSFRGAAQDLSAQGICFFLESDLKVRVRLGAEGEIELPGRLVRLDSVTDGKLVLAVRFDQRIDPRRLTS
jgi:hypothetical protein